jgi:hypothetical protein
VEKTHRLSGIPLPPKWGESFYGYDTTFFNFSKKMKKKIKP